MKQFTGEFANADGKLFGLDFYADNHLLALAHARHVALDKGLVVRKVQGVRAGPDFDPGLFYPLIPK